MAMTSTAGTDSDFTTAGRRCIVGRSAADEAIMTAAHPNHRVRQYRSQMNGIEAYALSSEHVFPRHSHSEFGIGVMLSGAHRSWSCVGQVEAFEGDVIMVNPGEVHDGAPMGGVPRSWRMLYIEPSLAQAAIAEESAKVPEVRPAVKDEALAVLVRALFAAVANPGWERLAKEEALVRTLASAFARHGSEPINHAPPTAPVRRVMERLSDEHCGHVSLAGLACLAGVSRFHLLRSFVRQTGLTPHAYLRQRRLSLAKPMLRTKMPLSMIAQDLGFADQSHFTRVFKRQFGITPGQYRAVAVGAPCNTVQDEGIALRQS
jgi:AraC-like DNA-binding protein